MELTVENREAVAEHLRRLGWMRPDEPLLALESAGAGNMNRTLRGRLPGRSLILKQAVPYVARYPHIAAPVDRLDSEVAFYRVIAGQPALARHAPALLGVDPAEHLLCLEDLGTAGDLTRWYSEGAGTGDAGLVDTLVAWLSVLHNLDDVEFAVPDNLAMRRLNHAHIFEVPFDTGNGAPLSASLASQQARLARDDALLIRAAELGQRYLAPPGSGAVLLHGDFYPGSWLRCRDCSVAVIDPEFCFVGPAEFDVGVLQAHLVFAGFTADAMTRCLAGYRGPAGFDPGLARAFAGVEIVRRLLGVAQLPLAADEDERCGWVVAAREMVLR